MRPEHTSSEEEPMSQSADPVRGPRDRETALSVAYLRRLGSTQEEAALAAGVDRRTVQRWEGSTWWPEVMQAACDRWLKGVVGLARHAQMKALAEPDGNLALKVLERTVPQLAPLERVANQGAIAKLDFASITDEQLSRIKAGDDPPGGSGTTVGEMPHAARSKGGRQITLRRSKSVPTLCPFRVWRNPKTLEAPPGFEPGIKDLQSSALPLGHGAIHAGDPMLNRYPCPKRGVKRNVSPSAYNSGSSQKLGDSLGQSRLKSAHMNRRSRLFGVHVSTKGFYVDDTNPESFETHALRPTLSDRDGSSGLHRNACVGHSCQRVPRH